MTSTSPRKIQGYERRRESTPVASGDSDSVLASCPAGKRVIGGGSYFENSSIGTQFAIGPDGEVASGYGDNSSPNDDVLKVDIVCASVGTVKGLP